jgi:hypothetical protein
MTHPSFYTLNVAKRKHTNYKSGAEYSNALLQTAIRESLN